MVSIAPTFLSLTPETSVAAMTEEIARLAKFANLDLSLEPKAVPKIPLKNPKACFRGVPQEVRNMVYEYLLVDPILNRIDSISKQSNYGAATSYTLSTSLLYVDSETSKEAVEILYGRNTFYLACLPSDEETHLYSRVHLSPITIFQQQGDRGFPSIRESRAAAKVRHWTVVISARDIGGTTPPWALQEFCRALDHTTTKTVHICLIPKYIEDGLGNGDYTDISALLQPLKLLRLIQSFQVRDASIFEIPEEIEQDENFTISESQLDGLDAVEQVQLTQLAQSNVPLECTFELYPVLLRYAQGFEQHSLFKKEMSFDKNERFTEEELGSQYRFYYQNPLHNPFRNEDVTHPVEAALMRAKIASNYEYLLTFKKERLAVIEYLEPGYQRIFGAACRLRDFVLDNKCDGGLFDVHRQYYAEDPHDGKNRQRATALVLLKEYIESFKRDMPLEIKSNIRLHQNIYNSFYSSLAINSFWQNAESAPETQDYDRFAEHYTSAVDHLDAEYLEIRQARRELFEGGLPELNFRGCDVDLELSCFDKKVDWSVNEISVVSREEEKEDFDHSDNDRNSDHQGWENDSSDDQVSVDRDSDGSGNRINLREWF